MRYLAMLLGTGAIVGLDQLTKYLTTTHILCRPYELNGQIISCAQAIDPASSAGLPQTIPALDGVFHLTHFHNTGMAFSLLEGARWLFLALTVLILTVAVLAVVKKWLTHPLSLVALTFIVGGGIGNMIDRALHGAVVDMIELEFMNFAVFNVADSFVCVGAALLVIWAIFFDRKKPEPVKEAEHDDSV